MKYKSLILYLIIILILIPTSFSVVHIKQDSTIEDKTIMLINLENHIKDKVYYNLTDISDGINVSNYTIKVRPGEQWVYKGDLI